MTCQVEIALRAHFCEALLQSEDPLVYLDPSQFKDKAIFWRNTSTLTSEIARSTDVFIAHNYANHDGQIPLWAATEVMSFGTLSKYIKNMTAGSKSAFHHLAKFYSYKTAKGNTVCPNQDMLTSWIHAVVVLRNICAHSSRVYNRSLSTKPKLLKGDQQNLQPPLRLIPPSYRFRSQTMFFIFHNRLFRKTSDEKLDFMILAILLLRIFTQSQ